MVLGHSNATQTPPSFPSLRTGSARGQVRGLTVVIVVGADLLHEFVIDAVKGNVNANDLEGLGAQPGHVALRLLLVADLGRVEVAQGRLLRPVCFLILDAAIESFGFLGLQGGLRGHFELHHFGGGHQAHRHVAQARGVVSEVDTEGPIAVVHDFPRDQQVEFNGFNVGMEVTPAKHFLKFSRFDYRPPFSSCQGLLGLGDVGQPVPEAVQAVRVGQVPGLRDRRRLHKQAQGVEDPRVNHAAHQGPRAVFVLPVQPVCGVHRRLAVTKQLWERKEKKYI